MQTLHLQPLICSDYPAISSSAGLPTPAFGLQTNYEREPTVVSTLAGNAFSMPGEHAKHFAALNVSVDSMAEGMNNRGLLREYAFLRNVSGLGSEDF